MKVIFYLLIAILLLFTNCRNTEVATIPCNDTNCAQCNSSVCTRCYSNCFPDQDNNRCSTCNEAIQNCYSCSFSQSDLKCTSCYSSYYFDDGSTCKSCSDAIPHCSSCSFSQNTVKCTSCEYRYYFEDGSTCLACSDTIPHCYYCSFSQNAVKCYSCEYRYYMDGDSTCKSCSDAIPHCYSCSYSQSTLKCDLCESYYYFDFEDNSCKACTIPHCSYCNKHRQYFNDENVTCSSCEGSMQPSDDSQECLQCSYWVDHCSSCYNNGSSMERQMICSFCSFGYSLDDSQKLCSQWWVTTVIILCSICCGLPIICVLGCVLGDKLHKKWLRWQEQRRRPIPTLLRQEMGSNISSGSGMIN